jgi:phosphohistidine phosphatase
MADWAAQVGLKVDPIRHSGKRRAEQTADLLGERLNPAKGVIAVEGLKPNDDVRPVAEAILAGQGTVMLVGHLPHLSRLANLLLTGDPETSVLRFQMAGIVCVSNYEAKWAVNWLMPRTCSPQAVQQDRGGWSLRSDSLSHLSPQPCRQPLRQIILVALCHLDDPHIPGGATPGLWRPSTAAA